MAYKYDVFISYRRKTLFTEWIPKTFIEPFLGYLQEELLREPVVFWDVDNVHVGDQWEKRLLEALATSKVLIPILIPSYFTREWCKREFAAFYHRQKQPKNANQQKLILPISLWEGQYPDYANKLQYLDWKDYHIVPMNKETDIHSRFRSEVAAFAKKTAIAIKNAPNWEEDWLNSKKWVETPYKKLKNLEIKMTTPPALATQ